MDESGLKRRRILFVIIAAAVIAAAGPLAFWLGGNLIGFIVVFAWIGLIGYILYRSGREPISDRDSIVGEAARSETSRRSVERRGGGRLLIAVGAASESEEIPAHARQLIERADAVRVIAPTLPTRFEWLASATDEAHEEADERLHAVLGQLDEIGAEPHGSVGADDPLQALEDAIRDFHPDHLLIALRSGGEADWQERGLLDSLDERFGIPTTVFELED